MKNLMCFYAAFMLGISLASVTGQNNYELEIPNHLPTDLQLDNSKVRSFKLTTDYMDYDLKGNFRSKTRVTGEYSIGLPGDSVRWNNIHIARAAHEESPFPEGEKQDYMENFAYIQDENIVSQAFFKDIPQANFMIKNLIWDVSGLYWFAYWNWDKLELNKTYKDTDINNQEIDLSGEGTFENRNVEITWIGLTQMNNETCAILKYATMNNPLKINLENMKMTGRSHYWGEIYVSLEDKEIEMATLSEDVVTDLKFSGNPENIAGYTVRKITLTRNQ